MKATSTRVTELDKDMALPQGSAAPLSWFEPGDPPFRLTGFPWFNRDRRFRRLPLQPPAPIRSAVSELADCTAGGQVAFQSNATRLVVKVELAGPYYMYHMPSTGQCGFDLYLGEPFAQRYHSTTRFDVKETAYEVELFSHPESTWRTFTLNFPLYQGVKRFQVGLNPGARVRRPPAWSEDRPIVIYGTSITQGGCASRPGLAYTNIISRALNRPVINLGFSGNGCGEPEVIQLVAGLRNPGLLVLDYEGNAGAFEAYRQTLPAAIALLRAAHPVTPLLVLSRIVFAREYAHAEAGPAREKRMRMQRELVRRLRAQGDGNLYFHNGATLLGPDADECTVDGVHPNDLGFMRMARRLAPLMKRLARTDERPTKRTATGKRK